MKILFLGTGGCSQIPIPTCNCKVCKEARRKGYPYARKGCSLFIEDINLLIDTPEDIRQSLLENNIEKIEYLTISHSDPDHTRGIRIVEEMGIDWIDHSNSHSLNAFMMPGVYEDINKTMFNTLKYYEKHINVLNIKQTNYEQINDVKINLINNFENAGNNSNMTFYVFEQCGKKIIYACCDVKPFYDNAIYNNADLLIIGCAIPDLTLKNGIKIDNEHKIVKTDLLTLEEIHNIKMKYNIKKVIITHIEEMLGKSYDDLLEFETNDLTFAFDGLKIEI